MLESAFRNALLLVLVSASLAPVASASILPNDLLGSLYGEGCAAHPAAAWTLERVDQRTDGADRYSCYGDSSDGGSQGSSSGGGAYGGAAGAYGPVKTVVATTRPVVGFALHTVDGVTDALPSDPVAFAASQVDPVRQTAQTIPGMILPPEEGQVDPPAPATASVQMVDTPDGALLAAAGATAAAAVVAFLWLAGSSGSLGAGAAGAGSAGKIASTDLRRLLPFASPLFTRFEKDTVLGHPKREALYALILQDPGVSLQSLCDSTGLSRTAVTHHLRLMELQHLIVSKRMGRSRHYYENGGRFGRDQKDAYAVLQNDRSKQVAQFVKQNPGAIQKAICAAVGVQASVAHWHLRRLQEAQLVEAVRSGRTVAYFPGVGLKGMDAPAPLPVAAPTPALTA